LTKKDTASGKRGTLVGSHVVGGRGKTWGKRFPPGVRKKKEGNQVGGGMGGLPFATRRKGQGGPNISTKKKTTREGIRSRHLKEVKKEEGPTNE